MIGRRRRGGMSLGRVAKKAAVATVVSRAVNNAMDNRMGHNRNQSMGQGFGGHQQPQQPVMNNICPSCHTGNLQNAKFCSNCGSGFATAQQTQQTASMTNCPGCKANLTGVNGNFCPYCRTAIR